MGNIVNKVNSLFVQLISYFVPKFSYIPLSHVSEELANFERVINSGPISYNITKKGAIKPVIIPKADSYTQPHKPLYPLAQVNQFGPIAR